MDSKDEKILKLISEICKLLGAKPETIDKLLGEARAGLNGENDTISVGDVVLKDLTIVSPKVAAKQRENILGVVFYVNGQDIRIVAPEYSERQLKFKEETTRVSDYLPSFEPHKVRGDMGGKMNTEIIRNAPDFSNEMYPAAGYCINYQRGKYDKGLWYLPSVGELAEIYKTREVINNILPLCGFYKMEPNWYTSSSEHTITHSWCLQIGTGYVNSYSKNNGGWVLPCLSLTL